MIFSKASLTAFLAWLCLCHASQELQELQDSYDYIIVGAGSAGSVLANRLTKDGSYSVLLLEAGGEMTDDLYVPFTAPFSANENNSWGYQTDPQSFALWDFPGKMASITQGKVMGGTSSLNSMNYVRGSRHDFEKWANDYKAPGWGYNDVLKYFKAIENFTVPDVSEEEVQYYHGRNGETPVNYPSYHTELSNIFLEACSEDGHKKVDYNGQTHAGYSRVQCNTLNGVRMGASTCFLNQYVLTQHKKLHISTKSEATKIIFDKDKRATGVKFRKGGSEKTVNVNREVIVSAGAVGSPKLLMLSGIGPKWHLEEKGIEVVAELPVGQGLQDHVVFLGLVVTTNRDLIGLAHLNESAAQYAYNRTGLFTIPGAFEALLFTHSGVDQGENDYPDMELELAAVFPNENIARSPYVTKEIYDQYYKPMIEKVGFMNALALVRPESRGAIYLRSSNPDDKPAINPQLLSGSTKDLFRLVNGTLKVKKLFDTPAMKKIGAEVWPLQYPHCKQFEVWTADYVTCFIQHTAFPGQHVCCTCAMGDHQRSVVDERLRVKGGVTGLRVADSSVMPAIVSGNTNAAVMMIAAKAADMIMEDATDAKL